ncbi:MAG: helix-turn-helix domain-containing protein [Actinobacteria bacterium]|nr:helix-turn-helix domain-containing protein [Actinomycetota bacterium]
MPRRGPHRDLTRQTQDYLAARLKAVRIAKGLDIAEVVRRTGLAWNTYAAYEKGKSTPGLAVLLALVRAMEMRSIEELLGGTQLLLLMEEEEIFRE